MSNLRIPSKRWGTTPDVVARAIDLLPPRPLETRAPVQAAPAPKPRRMKPRAGIALPSAEPRDVPIPANDSPNEQVSTRPAARVAPSPKRELEVRPDSLSSPEVGSENVRRLALREPTQSPPPATLRRTPEQPVQGPITPAPAAPVSQGRVSATEPTAQRAPFRSWAEERGAQGREFKVDRAALTRARQLRGQAERMKNAANEHGNLARATIARAAEEERRRTDPVERAKAFLGRRVPCYSAEVAGGPAGHFVIGSRVVTRDELLAAAREKGWVE